MFWAIPPSGPLPLGRHQGVGLRVIVQVFLAASTSMRAKGEGGLGGEEKRLGGSLTQPWAELRCPFPVGHSLLKVTLTERMGVESPQCLLCALLKAAARPGCQHRRGLALGESPRRTPAAKKEMSGHKGAKSKQDAAASRHQRLEGVRPRRPAHARAVGHEHEGEGLAGMGDRSRVGAQHKRQRRQLATGVWTDTGDL